MDDNEVVIRTVKLFFLCWYFVLLVLSLYCCGVSAPHILDNTKQCSRTAFDFYANSCFAIDHLLSPAALL